MPKVRTNRIKYPNGWELIEPTLRDLETKMREAEQETHEGKRKCETLWPIFRAAHQKSRYVFDLYYRRKEISKELYEFCLDQGYADRNLIAKWRKSGYERLCCLRCMQPRDHNFATTCVCRVPKHLREEKVIECVHCGCRGCASGDWLDNNNLNSSSVRHIIVKQNVTFHSCKFSPGGTWSFTQIIVTSTNLPIIDHNNQFTLFWICTVLIFYYFKKRV